ncbi:MAG: hypothetical protein SCARUB_04661 [Candidatus Scalindua rubra]|uniref:Uncharacterized protein n=1 Tax=Candidatus Scalindua rubra TaxID=1872076 RepID=A0A1E3X3K9_9BACT|nr:MAG: hypothetical protein SCARUB_04661 [Candidatus Scalindua rubra]
MYTPQWFFEKHVKGAHIVSHINAEFFKTDHIDNLPSAFVRETIQNSLDAKSQSKGKVSVHFRLGTMSRKHFDSFLLDQLSQHVHAVGSGITDTGKSAFRRNFNFIVCEDFNTIGLCGDVSYADNAMPMEENDFYFFFRNDGRSGKKFSLGKWGVGKTIFPAVSHLNMFWAMTVREADKKEYLMGRAILGHHTIKNKGYTPWGYYGIRKDSESILVLPDEDPERIGRFKKIFSLERKDKPGLSIVVPFINDGFDAETILYACISQYLYPIANGDLEISVSHRSKNWTMNSDSIEDIIKECLNKDSNDHYRKIDSTLKFIRYINQLSTEDYILLRKSSLNKVPRWSARTLFDDETLQSCRESFERGDNLNFIVPVQIHSNSSENEWGRFRLHIERDDDLNISEDLYIREGLKIPGVSSIGGRRLRGIFIADQPPLTDLLGAAENPAHTEWQPDAEGFKDKYENTDTTLSFLKNSLARITNILTKPLDDVDVDLLAEWFPFEVSGSSTKRGTKTKKKKGKKRETPKPPINPYVPIASVQQYSCGFKVRKNPDYDKDLYAIEVITAYRTVKGNPLKRYNPLDFSFQNGSDIEIETEGLKTLEIKDNRLLFEVIDHDYFLTVNGFDENRDIYVKVMKVGL